MTREGRNAKGSRLLMSFLLLIAIGIAPLARPAGALTSSGTRRASPIATGGAGSGSGDEISRWWGVAGAALCGLEIRFIIRVPAVGMNPYALAAGIAGCGLAALDLATT